MAKKNVLRQECNFVKCQPPACRQMWTDKHDWKHYLPITSLEGDNNSTCTAETLVPGWRMTSSAVNAGLSVPSKPGFTAPGSGACVWVPFTSMGLLYPARTCSTVLLSCRVQNVVLRIWIQIKKELQTYQRTIRKSMYVQRRFYRVLEI